MASLTAAQTRHVKTAEAHLKEAKKKLTTSFTKWTKDYLMAGPEFAKAATAYRLAKQPEKAVDCYLSAVDCAQRSGQTFEVAKYRDLAAQILRKDPSETSQRRAAELYQESLHTSLGMEDYIGATDVAQKAAQIWSKVDPARGITLYRETIEQLQNVGKAVYALEMFRNAVSLAIRCERWEMARDMTTAALSGFIEAGRPPSALYGWHLTEIILLAKIGDTVALDETFLESLGTQGYGKSDQAEAAEEINRGIKDRDVERLSKVMDLRGMTHGGLHPDVLKLARNMWAVKGAVSQGSARGKNYRGQRSELFGGSGTQGKGVSANKATTLAVTEQANAAKGGVASAAASTAASTAASNDLLDGIDDLLAGIPSSAQSTTAEILGDGMAEEPVDRSEAPVSPPAAAAEEDEEFL